MKYRRSSDIALLFNELAILLQGGVDVSEALQIMQAEPDPVISPIVQGLIQDINTGTTLSDALAKQPQHFEPFIVSTVQKAEKSGQLVDTLYAIVSFLENDVDERELTKQMGLSLIYIAFLLGIALVVTMGLLTYVVPTFDELYASFGAELPLITQFFIMLGDYAGAIALILLVGIGVSIVAWYRIAFNLPFLGKLYHLTAVSHVLHTMSFILQQGGTLQQALAETGQSIHYNHRYSQALIQISQQLEAGTSITEQLKATRLFPQKVIHSFHIGESRPNFGQLLQQLAAVYRLKVNQNFEPRMRLFSFVLLLFIGCFIGALVIAMYLPIFKMGAVL